MNRRCTPRDCSQEVPQRRWSATLTLSGLLSSFGCAACCALPIVLAGTSLAGVWTLHLQVLVGPYERWWLWGSIVMLGLGAVSWGREMRRLATRCQSRVSVITYAITPLILIFSAALLAGTLMVEHASLTDFL
jgi:mercuric ion transport protein